MKANNILRELRSDLEVSNYEIGINPIVQKNLFTAPLLESVLVQTDLE
jgi:hypothetical protein